jgi:predicted DNA-binding WGR domain protein
MVNESRTTTLLNTDDGHRKFYTVTVTGKAVHLHWGRIGTTGQRKVMNFSLEEAARSFAREKINDKLYTRGYERMVG